MAVATWSCQGLVTSTVDRCRWLAALCDAVPNWHVCPVQELRSLTPLMENEVRRTILQSGECWATLLEFQQPQGAQAQGFLIKKGLVEKVCGHGRMGRSIYIDVALEEAGRRRKRTTMRIVSSHLPDADKGLVTFRGELHNMRALC